jgi:hypothetical protein
MFIKKGFPFFEPFLRLWHQSLKKYKYGLYKFFLKSKNLSKNAVFHADFKSVDNVLKNVPNKSY